MSVSNANAWKWAAFILAVVIGAAAVVSRASSPHSVAHSGPWIYGPAKARFTVTEYADLECPYCRDYFPELKVWIEATPNVNWRWHNLPLSIHEPAASQEAILAECAGLRGGNSSFWATVEAIYQQTRTNGAGPAAPLSLQPPLELADLQQCASSRPEIAAAVHSQAQEAASAGIEGTPTLVITDNIKGNSLKLQGAPSRIALLSALDWLASRPSQTEKPSANQ